jgi:hypothetical protein
LSLLLPLLSRPLLLLLLSLLVLSFLPLHTRDIAWVRFVNTYSLVVLLFHLLFNSANALFFSSFVLMALICSWVYGGRPADAIIAVL